MRILVAHTCYDEFLKLFYGQHPELKNLTYAEHHASLMAQRFAESDAYSFYLTKYGCEALDVIVNDLPLQAKWACENKASVFPLPLMWSNAFNLMFGIDWRFDVLRAQVKRFKPDVLYIHEQSILTDSYIEELKRYVRLVVTQTASPLVSRRKFTHDDIIVSSMPHYVERFRQLGKKAEFVPLAFDARVLDEKELKTNSTYRLTFVGGVSKSHRNRMNLLQGLAENFELSWFGYGVENVPPNSALRKSWKGKVWGLDMYNVLKMSDVTVNSHIDAASAFANNLRLYEATGVGTCLVTDAKTNLNEYFNVGKEVVSYDDLSSLTKAVSELLDNSSLRCSIAQAGHRRTLQDHTYDQRIPELIHILKRHLS